MIVCNKKINWLSYLLQGECHCKYQPECKFSASCDVFGCQDGWQGYKCGTYLTLQTISNLLSKEKIKTEMLYITSLENSVKNLNIFPPHFYFTAFKIRDKIVTTFSPTSTQSQFDTSYDCHCVDQSECNDRFYGSSCYCQEGWKGIRCSKS